MKKSPWFAALTGALLFACACLVKEAGIAFVLPLLIAASALWVSAALDVVGCASRIVRGATYLSFAVRWSLAVGLYCASYYHWPIGRSLQVGNGFWLFCMDALNYHSWAPQILHAVSWGLPLPDPQATLDYYLIVAFIYGLFGTSPLTAIAINILAWTIGTVILIGLFSRLRDEPMPWPVAVLILFWPSGLIWSTQVMKDALVFLALVVAVAAASAMTESRRSARSVATAAVWFGLALIPLIRLRVYVGRMLLVSTALAACFALVWMVRDRRAWRSVLGAAVSCAIVYWGLIFILAPDPFVVFAPENAPSANSPTVVSSHVGANHPPPRLHQVRIVAYRLAESAHGAIARYGFFGVGGFGAMSPSALGMTRDKFAATGGDSALGDRRHLNGWADVARLSPRAIADGLFAPFPWDIVRPRGITGAFRTFAVSESLLMFFTLPALLLGVLRLRRPNEWLVLAIAGGGILALSLVIVNLGTLFRLRVAFTLLLIPFASYGLDVYPAMVDAASRGSHRLRVALFGSGVRGSVERPLP